MCVSSGGRPMDATVQAPQGKGESAERMTVRMGLAAALHHSASKSAKAETNDASRSWKTVNSKEQPVFFELYEEDTAGWRPAPVSEVAGPQERVQRHTSEQIVGFAPMVQSLLCWTCGGSLESVLRWWPCHRWPADWTS